MEEILENAASEAEEELDLDGWRRRALAAEREIYERDFEAELSRALDLYEFSSDAVRCGVMRRIQEAGLPMENGEIVGLTDMLEAIRGEDAGVFMPAVRFTDSIRREEDATTKDKIMAIKDRQSRRAAIAANLKLFHK